MSVSRIVRIAFAGSVALIASIVDAGAQRISIGGGGLTAKSFLDGGAPLTRRPKIVAKAVTPRVVKKPVIVAKPVRPTTTSTTKIGGNVGKPKRPVGSVSNTSGNQNGATTNTPGNPKRPGNSAPPRDPKPPVVADRPPVKLPPIVVRPPSNRPPQWIPPAVTFVPALPPVRPPSGGSGYVPPPPPSSLPPLPPIASGPPPSLQSLDTFVPDEVLVTLASTTPQTLEADVAQAFNVVILDRTPLPLIDARLVRMRIPDSRTVPAVVAAIDADARVSLAQANFIYRPSSDPAGRVQPAAISGIGAQSALQYALTAVNLAGAQRLAPNQGRGARVAVIDSGVDRAHPDFAAARIDEFDAFAGEQKSAEQADRHGTGIAGIIAARGTIQGVAPAAEVLSARVFRAKTGQPSISTTQRVLQGMTWSAERGARVLNMSFAGPRDGLVERHVAAVVAKGMIPVAAAGNGGPDATPAYPAAYDKVIAVTAIDAAGELYEKANRGNYVAIAAPGVDVIVPGEGQSHEFQSGTSYAAAHVSGIVALMLEVDPDLTPDVARALLERASHDLGSPGRDEKFGYGKVDAERAVQLAMENRTR